MTSRNERNHYRIQFPVNERPKFRAGRGQYFDVVNMSEQGLSIVGVTERLKVGAHINGRITLPDNQVVVVGGRIIRKTLEEAIIHLDKVGVPLPVIMELQRYLLQKYNSLE